MILDAQKRLEAIEAAGDLGWLSIGVHDMEIRGAVSCWAPNNRDRSISRFFLTSSMLESAVAALRQGDIPDIDQPLDTGTEEAPCRR